MARCFRIHAADNVATLLEDCDAGELSLTGPVPGRLIALRAIPLAHKVALCGIAPGEAVVKYGVRIGTATTAIPRGEWVHVHNCRSDYDERRRSGEAPHE